MNLYVTKVNEQGSLIVSDTQPKVSRLGIRRTPGQRYQVPSILRAATETGSQDVVDAAATVLDDLRDNIERDGFAVIDWAEKTDTPCKMLINNEMVETTRKWADLNLDKLDDVLEAVIKAGKPAATTTNTTRGGKGARKGANLAS